VRVGGDGHARVAIRVANAARPLDAVEANERDSRARHTGVVEHLLDRRREFVQAVRMRISRRGLRAQHGRRGYRQCHSERRPNQFLHFAFCILH
jgi:hypothetical protein